ncbi:nitroreductase family protein [Halorussus salinus]|uniref:nitroreductase family protein n=1 Tax=Halorussus salinus TaxID=1364935 RepID=UPI001091E493|nr:nitroreductase family protein [Halorussus salinus]
MGEQNPEIVRRPSERERRGLVSRASETIGETVGQVSLRRRWVGGPRPWRVSASAFPKESALEKRARFLVRYAVLAPSSHNTQPWLFTADDDEIRLFADLDRWLTVADHDKRELYLSLGAALENLLVAADHFGLGFEVAYMPGSDSSHAATVRLSESSGSPQSSDSQRSPESPLEGGDSAEESSADYRGARLFTAIPHRRTSRGRFRATPIPTADLAALDRHCVEADVSLQMVADAETLDAIADLTARANRRLYADYAYRRELGRWVGRGAFGDPWPAAKVGKLAVSHLNLGRQRARKDGRAIREGPVVAALRTDDDGRRSQIRAGQVFERLSLLATALGIGIHPVSAALEVGGLRRELVDLLGRPDRPAQHLFRLGYPERESEERRSPRRPAEAVLVD